MAFVCTLYLPASEEGRKVLYRMKEAFDQRVLFKIDQQEKLVTFNGFTPKVEHRGE